MGKIVCKSGGKGCTETECCLVFQKLLWTPISSYQPVCQPLMRPLTIQLFGAFTLQRDGQTLPPTRTRKEQWLLALLLLRYPQQVERAWLAATLWADSADDQARENLRHSLSN